VVTEVVAYRTIEAPDGSAALLAAALDDGPIDALVLTSGSTVRGSRAVADAANRPALLDTPVITIGEPTARVARDLGFRTVLTAPSPSAPALAAFVATALGVARDRPGATPARQPEPVPAAPGGTR
jgi:uroporphyrinogen-III synthase